MQLEWIEGEVFRCYVDGYLIDFRAYWGVGWCGCPDAGCNRQKELSEIGRMPDDPNAYRCKHLKWSRREVALELLDTVLKLDGELREH